MKKVLLSLLALSLCMTPVFAQETESSTKGQEKREKWAEFHKEKSALRKTHLEKMRSRHIELVGQLYDLKLKHLNELDVLGSKAESLGTKEERKAVYKEIKEKREKNREIEKDFRENTIKKELKQMSREFRKEFKDKRRAKKHE